MDAIMLFLIIWLCQKDIQNWLVELAVKINEKQKDQT